jgi:hypothetical protein
MIFGKALVAWTVMVLTALANGSLRERYLTPRWGVQTGHLISSAILSVAVILIAVGYLLHTGPLPLRTLRLIGLFWVLVSILFVFFFRTFVLKETWSRLVADNRIMNGRLGLMVLVTQAVAPVLAGRMLGYWS